MGVREQIHQTDEYQQFASTSEQGGGQQPAARQSGTVAGSFGPILEAEKGDVEFWLQVVQVVLLYLILKELQRGGR